MGTRVSSSPFDIARQLAGVPVICAETFHAFCERNWEVVECEAQSPKPDHRGICHAVQEVVNAHRALFVALHINDQPVGRASKSYLYYVHRLERIIGSHGLSRDQVWPARASLTDIPSEEVLRVLRLTSELSAERQEEHGAVETIAAFGHTWKEFPDTFAKEWPRERV